MCFNHTKLISGWQKQLKVRLKVLLSDLVLFRCCRMVLCLNMITDKMLLWPLYLREIVDAFLLNRAQELCESWRGLCGLPVPDKPDGFCGCKTTLKWKKRSVSSAWLNAMTKTCKSPPPPPPPHTHTHTIPTFKNRFLKLLMIMTCFEEHFVPVLMILSYSQNQMTSKRSRTSSVFFIR